MCGVYTNVRGLHCKLVNEELSYNEKTDFIALDAVMIKFAIQ